MDDNDRKAKETCAHALLAWGDAVKKCLPNANKSYLIMWTLDDARYVQSETNKAIDTILSFDMYKHYATELRELQGNFESAIKENDIRKCKQLLMYVLWRFCILLEMSK